MGADDLREELLRALREFLAKSAPGELVDQRSWWDRLGELGVFALAVPEPDGGLGLGLAAAATAFEALGESRAPGPLVWTALAALVSADVAGGGRLVAGVDLVGRVADEPTVVPHLADADELVVLDERGVVRYARGQVTAIDLDAAIDPTTPVARLDALGEGEVLAGPDVADRLRAAGTLLSAAGLVGLSEGALRAATEYAAGRHQFGRPIGSFQAVKHLLADAYTRTNLARAAVYAAAELADADRLASEDIAVAKLLSGRAADANARTAVQVFGGMGFAAETPPHLFLKRAWVLEHEFGTVHDHAQAVGDAVGSAVGSAVDAGGDRVGASA